MLSENVTGPPPPAGLEERGRLPKGPGCRGRALSGDSYKAAPQRDGGFRGLVPGAQAVLGGREAPGAYMSGDGRARTESKESPLVPEETESCSTRAFPRQGFHLLKQRKKVTLRGEAGRPQGLRALSGSGWPGRL